MNNPRPDITYPRFSELTGDEKDLVIDAILEHIGRRIEAIKFDGDDRRLIGLVKERDAR